jgi:hypothetical protein
MAWIGVLPAKIFFAGAGIDVNRGQRLGIVLEPVRQPQVFLQVLYWVGLFVQWILRV